MKPIATALLLNWKRPENIVKTIASIRPQKAPFFIRKNVKFLSACLFWAAQKVLKPHAVKLSAEKTPK